MSISLPDVTDDPSTIFISTQFCVCFHEYYDRLPASTVIVNFEAMGLWPGRPCFDNVTYLSHLNGKPVWDYSENNVAWLRAKGILPAGHSTVPLFWFTGITASRFDDASMSARRVDKDIDVLFLGGADFRRAAIIDELRRRGLSVVEISEVAAASSGHKHGWSYNKNVREEYIRRSKVVLNIHRGPEPPADLELNALQAQNFPLETVRLQYLLSARAFVISEVSERRSMDAFASSVVFVLYRDMVAVVCAWLQRDEKDRRAVADTGYAYITSRRMTDVLRLPMQAAVLELHARTCEY
jgi:hypothetical protein